MACGLVRAVIDRSIIDTLDAELAQYDADYLDLIDSIFDAADRAEVAA